MSALPPQGRRAAEALAQDTTPGKILVLALAANLPIFVMIIVQAITADREAGRRFAPMILYGTPVLAGLALVLYFRAPRERRAHNASRWGFRLALAGILLWALAALGEIVARR